MVDETYRTHKKVGVAFTGAGLRGLANLALIELFEEVDFKPDFLIGCSGGAAIAGLWAQGLSSSDILIRLDQQLRKDVIRGIDLYSFLFFYKKPRGSYKKEHALLKVNKLYKLYKNLFNDTRLEDLLFPTAVQATDIETGASMVFEQGLLKDIVYASSAMLPFLPPKCIDNKWYADGSFSSPMPIMEMVTRGMDHIISFSFMEQAFTHPKDFLSYYSNFVSLAFTKAQRTQVTFAIEFHHGETLLLPVKTHMESGIFSRREIEHMIEGGRQTVRQYRDEILRLIKR